MNTKATLKNLHETFPDFDAETLIKILDCYVEEVQLPNPSHSGPVELVNTPYVTLNKSYPPEPVYCSY